MQWLNDCVYIVKAVNKTLLVTRMYRLIIINSNILLLHMFCCKSGNKDIIVPGIQSGMMPRVGKVNHFSSIQGTLIHILVRIFYKHAISHRNVLIISLLSVENPALNFLELFRFKPLI
jgi:hypothetical protein